MPTTTVKGCDDCPKKPMSFLEYLANNALTGALAVFAIHGLCQRYATGALAGISWADCIWAVGALRMALHYKPL